LTFFPGLRTGGLRGRIFSGCILGEKPREVGSGPQGKRQAASDWAGRSSFSGALNMSSTLGLKGIFRDVLSLSGAQVLAIPLSFLSASMTTRFLGPEGYGALALAFSVAQLVFLFGINWMASALVRFGREELIQEGSIRKTFWTCLSLLLLCWTLSVIPLVFSRRPIARYSGVPEDGQWAIYAMALAIALASEGLFLLQAFGRMQWYALVSLSEKCFFIVLLLLAFLFATPIRAMMVFLVALWAKALQVLLGCWGFRSRDFLPPILHGPTFRLVFRFCWPYIFAFSGGYVVDWIDIYVIRYYLTLGDVGTYQLAYQAMAALSGLLMALSTPLFAIITDFRVQGRHDLLHRYATRLTPQVGFSWGLGLLVVSAVSPIVFAVLFGTRFAGAILPFKILLVGVAFRSITVMYSPILWSYDLAKQSTGVVLCMGFTNLLGDLLLVPRLGTAGAAVATSASYALGSILYLFLGSRRLAASAWSTLPALLPALVGLGALLYARSVPAALVIMLAAVLVGCVWATRIGLFRREDLQGLDSVEMPRLLKRGIRHAVLVLSR
jgi:O-antigen/teichoic acid export membrane protein